MLHLVTDRRRLAPGAAHAEAVACLVEQVRFAVAAGIDVIQIRERDLEGRSLASLTSAVVRVTRGSRTRVVVNDRIDVALASGADGVHLRATSVDAAAVRSCSRPGFLVGRSVHTAPEAAAAGPVDYLLAGTVWATASKPEPGTLLGTAGLADIVRAAGVPVLAIGGVEPERAGELVPTGVAGVAAIGVWMAPGGSPCRAESVNATVEAFRAAFDAANMRPVPPVR